MTSPYALPGFTSRFEFDADHVYLSPSFSQEGSPVSTQGSDGSVSDSRPHCLSLTDCTTLNDFNAAMEPYVVQRFSPRPTSLTAAGQTSSESYKDFRTLDSCTPSTRHHALFFHSALAPSSIHRQAQRRCENGIEPENHTGQSRRRYLVPADHHPGLSGQIVPQQTSQVPSMVKVEPQEVAFESNRLSHLYDAVMTNTAGVVDEDVVLQDSYHHHRCHQPQKYHQGDVVKDEYYGNGSTLDDFSASSSAADSSPSSSSCSPFHAFQRRGSLQLWQFLVALLDNQTNSSFIAWTGRGLEFKLIEPEEVARRWGIQKNRPAMNYDKLSRSLRYYYEKGIMQKVAGERYVYRFVCDPAALVSAPHRTLDSPQQGQGRPGSQYPSHIDLSYLDATVKDSADAVAIGYVGDCCRHDDGRQGYVVYRGDREMNASKHVSDLLSEKGLDLTAPAHPYSATRNPVDFCCHQLRHFPPIQAQGNYTHGVVAHCNPGLLEVHPNVGECGEQGQLNDGVNLYTSTPLRGSFQRTYMNDAACKKTGFAY